MSTQQLRGKIKEEFASRPGGGGIETSPQRAQSRRRQQAKRAQAYDSVGVALVGDPKGSGSAVVVWNNDEIARRARRAISSDYCVPRDKVEIRIEQGWLTLIGDLNWLYERHAAEADVRVLPGVFGVTNAIAIKQSEASELRALGMATSGPANARRYLR
jgi:osmotically-inducible protein OsmY